MQVVRSASVHLQGTFYIGLINICQDLQRKTARFQMFELNLTCEDVCMDLSDSRMNLMKFLSTINKVLESGAECFIVMQCE